MRRKSLYSKENFVEQYLLQAQIQMECTFSGNYRKGNRASDKLFAMNAFLKENFEAYREIADQLIESEHPNASLWITDVALDMHYRTDEVIDKTKRISQDKSLSLIALDAKMFLKTRNIL